MRIPNWTPELKAQPEALVQAITERRGGTLLNLDRTLLWSEPLARGWNVYLKAVRTDVDQPPAARVGNLYRGTADGRDLRVPPPRP